MAVVGRPIVEAWDGLAAAPQLLLIEAFAAEADVLPLIHPSSSSRFGPQAMRIIRTV
jgi:hypothetical protein